MGSVHLKSRGREAPPRITKYEALNIPNRIGSSEDGSWRQLAFHFANVCGIFGVWAEYRFWVLLLFLLSSITTITITITITNTITNIIAITITITIMHSCYYQSLGMVPAGVWII